MSFTNKHILLLLLLNVLMTLLQNVTFFVQTPNFFQVYPDAQSIFVDFKILNLFSTRITVIFKLFFFSMLKFDQILRKMNKFFVFLKQHQGVSLFEICISFFLIKKKMKSHHSIYIYLLRHTFSYFLSIDNTSLLSDC